ncbi:MAG: hypothetical protein ACR2MO_13335 [Acidimicrobiales bacterium]
MSAMNRRELLLAGAGLALVAACGSKKDDDVVAKVTDPSGNTAAKGLNLVVATYFHVSGIDERVTAAIINAEGTSPVALDGPVELTIDGQPVESTIHQDGTPLPYMLVHHRFAVPGVAMLKATFKGATGEAAVQVVDPNALKVPSPGKPMIVTPSPTAANTLGVDPICTAEPICPLHEVSLDAALAEKRPLAVLFSTPARCQSRFCGPVLDTLISQREAFGDKVRFLHVEIWKTRTGSDVAPTTAAYGLEQEPVLFLAGADGVVRERLDNAYDRVEAKAALERLVS